MREILIVLTIAQLSCGGMAPANPYSAKPVKRERKVLTRTASKLYCFAGHVFFADKANGKLFVRVTACADKEQTCKAFREFEYANYADHAQMIKFKECEEYENPKAKPEEG